MEALLLFVGGMALLGILVVPLSQRLGAPMLLLVLAVGMLLGEDGIAGVQFDDFSAAYTVGSIALAIILFAGGLETDLRKTRGARFPAVLLATVGVVITALVTGFAATQIIGVSIEVGMLLGAVVASTDAAATFLMIQHGGVHISDRLRGTLVLESGLNDPMAIFLTILMTTLVDSGTKLSWDSLHGSLPLLASQLGLGGILGVVSGRAAGYLIDRVCLPEGLYPPFALVTGLVVYSGTALAGGSGFLAVYLCGMFLANSVTRPFERILQFNEGLQWLSQILLFLMLGLLVTPSGLLANLPKALMVAAVLMFLARPVAVLLCAVPLGFSVKETAFLGWVGLRGAVPIFLAIFPVITPGPVNVEFFNIVFVVVVTSLLLQGSTISLTARWLGLSKAQPPAAPPSTT
ncbi:MAG: potassium/proton antiporter [Hyphomicrobiaceae bacterium]|nr:potassium/proton antiporter [Hyphomicrobiaceae bacterium]MCC0008868.1 potassium/proton antiporter [Hyphomicrobiaceae bacterium]